MTSSTTAPGRLLPPPMSLLVLPSLLLLLLVALCHPQPATAMPSPRGVCSDPRRLMEPAAQRICNFVVAFKNIGDFTEAMEDLLEAKVVRNTMALGDPEVKRQDLDHVFLRFGRAQREQ